MEITATNANELFEQMFWKFKIYGEPVNTRNGPAMRIPEPVLTQVDLPTERVLFHKGRDANPIFHLLESIWMLAGRRDVEFLQRFNSKIGQYSDDGEVFNAAYGHRMRWHFGVDQLTGVIDTLRADPESRQAVVQLWDAQDLQKKTRDKACNTQLVFEVYGGALNMTVFNRSNDAWFGYAGANIVHMTVIQEFVAYAVGVPVGSYRTFSTNLHLYSKMYPAAPLVDNPPSREDYDLYLQGEVQPSPLIVSGSYESFLIDCQKFCSDPFNLEHDYVHPFFNHVARPMAMVSRVRNLKAGVGRGWAAKIRASDWRRAVFDWIDRREAARTVKA